MSPDAQLVQGLSALDVKLAPEQLEKLSAYLALLAKWNAVYNLTAIREPSKMISHHLLDSLAALPYLGQGRLLDVGSGGGLPGIPVAVARPQMPVTLLDSNQKKSAFLRQAAIELQLPRIEVVCQRVEDYAPPQLFDTIVSRAFAELGEFVAAARHLLAPGGVFAAMKGVNPHEEISRLPAGVRMREVRKLAVPGIDAERHLILLNIDAPVAA